MHMLRVKLCFGLHLKVEWQKEHLIFPCKTILSIIKWRKENFPFFRFKYLQGASLPILSCKLPRKYSDFFFTVNVYFSPLWQQKIVKNMLGSNRFWKGTKIFFSKMVRTGPWPNWREQSSESLQEDLREGCVWACFFPGRCICSSEEAEDVGVGAGAQQTPGNSSLNANVVVQWNYVHNGTIENKRIECMHQDALLI